jgi:hypothetical protein
MQYPLTLTFKFFALAPQISIVDGRGQMQMYVRQKLLKLKEVINIFTDESRSQDLYRIEADRIIDFSARYNFFDRDNRSIGAVKRRGVRSIWKAHYDIFTGDRVVFTIQEKDPWIKVLDSLFAEIPVVGWFTGYVFNPSYIVQDIDGRIVTILSKQPTFLSRIFQIEATDSISPEAEIQILLSLMMLLLLERSRG